MLLESLNMTSFFCLCPLSYILNTVATMVLLKYKAIHDTPLIKTLHQSQAPWPLLSHLLLFFLSLCCFLQHTRHFLTIGSLRCSCCLEYTSAHISTGCSLLSASLIKCHLSGGFPQHTYQSMSCQEKRNHCFLQRKFNSGIVYTGDGVAEEPNKED